MYSLVSGAARTAAFGLVLCCVACLAGAFAAVLVRGALTKLTGSEIVKDH